MRPTRCRDLCAWLLGVVLLIAPAASADEAARSQPAVDATSADPTRDPDAAPDPLYDEEADDEDYAAELGASVPDPIEPLNRQFFRFNDGVDQYVMLPVTDAYQFVFPKPVRMCVRRFFRNLKSPVYFVNNLFQLRFVDAAQTLAGFALNSTAGFVGLFDPASNVGWKQHPADFGQTLGFYGVKSGPYLVVPLLGPSTLRDGTGDIVDRAFDPLTYLFGVGNLLWIGGSSGFVTREANAKALAALRESSVDYYAAMRSAYTQNRESRIAALRSRFACMRREQETAAAK